MIPIRIIDPVVVDSGVELQVIAEIIVAFYRISRSREEVGVWMNNHLAEKYNQDQQACAHKGQHGDCVFLHKSISYVTGNIAKFGYFMRSNKLAKVDGESLFCDSLIQ